MNPNQLAGLVAVAIAVGAYISWRLTRRVTAHPATAGAGIFVVAAWTVLVAGIPYSIFVLGVSGAKRRGTLSGIGSLVIGLLPLILIAAPIVGLVLTVRHFAHHVRRHFILDEPGDTIHLPRQDRANDLRNRDPGDTPAAGDNPPDQGATGSNRGRNR